MPAPAKLADILENPSSFAEKQIVLEGNFAKRNCNYCFLFKEGLDSVKIEPKGFHSPKLKPGTPVQIRGRVRVKKQEVVIEAEAVSSR